MTDTTEANAAQAAKKLGRPRKADPQRVDYHQLDTLLVMGEMRVDAERGPVTEYPSYRELAKRFGISHSLVAAYSSRHNCLRRREAASEKIRKVTDEKVIARRGTALAEAKERILAIIDRFHEEFGVAVALINAGLVDLKPLVSATLPYRDAGRAFALAADRSRSMKVILSFD